MTERNGSKSYPCRFCQAPWRSGQQYATLYNEAFTDVPGIIIPPMYVSDVVKGTVKQHRR